MNVIATVRQFKTEKNIEETYQRIKTIYNLGIKHFRISIFDFEEEHIFSTLRLCQMLNLKLNNIEILLDLSYPYGKTRIVETKNNTPFCLKKGQKLSIYSKLASPACDQYIKVNINDLSSFPKRIEYADGKGLLVVDSVIDHSHIIAYANNDIIIYNQKSFGTETNIITLDTQKKILFQLFLEAGVKTLLFSFVSNSSDVSLCKNNFPNFNIISKIETSKAVENIDSICRDSDGIFLARGDLGLNIPYNKFVASCNLVINTSKLYNKKLIVGTDILDSLSYRNKPSRSDIVDLTYILENNPDYIVLNGNVVVSSNLEYALKLISNF